MLTKSIDAGVTRPYRTMWSLTGSQGDGWNLAQAPILFNESAFFIFMEAVVGKGFDSDIGKYEINIYTKRFVIVD